MVLLGQTTIRGVSVWAAARGLPLVIALFIGLALANLRGVLEGLLGRSSPFVRTPKPIHAEEPRVYGELAASIDTGVALSKHPAEMRKFRA